MNVNYEQFINKVAQAEGKELLQCWEFCFDMLTTTTGTDYQFSSHMSIIDCILQTLKSDTSDEIICKSMECLEIILKLDISQIQRIIEFQIFSNFKTIIESLKMKSTTQFCSL